MTYMLITREYSHDRLCRGLGALSILLFVACAGCGGQPASVTGKVTLDGETLDRGTVNFHPTTGGQLATGTIQSNGSYSLTTNREQGLQTGEYLVSVILRERGQQSELGGPPMPGKFIVPRRYARPETSDLSFQVSSGSNRIDIELSSETP